MVAVWRMARLEEVRLDWETNEQSPAEIERVRSDKRSWASGLGSNASHETGLGGRSTMTQYP